MSWRTPQPRRARWSCARPARSSRGRSAFLGSTRRCSRCWASSGELDPTHRDALRVALGLGAGPAPERLLVSNAALALLRHTAARVPVVLIVDDLPWIDRASAGVLSFVARRLGGSRAGLLAACRTGAESYFDRGGLLEYELKALDDHAADHLVRTRFPGLDPRVRSRVLDAAQGNPLALLELPQALSDAQRSAREPLPSVLPLGQRLQELFTSRVMRLPPATRATPPGRGPGGHRGYPGAGSDGRPRVPARRSCSGRARPAGAGGRGLAPHHLPPPARPLRGGRGIDPWRTPAVPTRRWPPSSPISPSAWPGTWVRHASRPDERVASLLEDAAHRVGRRGDAPGAVARLTRAAELSPAADGRGRRLALAAYIGAEIIGEMRAPRNCSRRCGKRARRRAIRCTTRRRPPS